ncbi:unnamed protein product [Clavelina lepadiformis]|uniref:C2H2-type domain-containing protein n=1 Tax=Clavelina lepadiformis TaxID=159417 RepID=A0ABP0H1I8_CLALP
MCLEAQSCAGNQCSAYERKMPRTKQTKPRHIVENDKTTEGGLSPTSTSSYDDECNLSDDEMQEIPNFPEAVSTSSKCCQSNGEEFPKNLEENPKEAFITERPEQGEHFMSEKLIQPRKSSPAEETTFRPLSASPSCTNTQRFSFSPETVHEQTTSTLYEKSHGNARHQFCSKFNRTAEDTLNKNSENDEISFEQFGKASLSPGDVLLHSGNLHKHPENKIAPNAGVNYREEDVALPKNGYFNNTQSLERPLKQNPERFQSDPKQYQMFSSASYYLNTLKEMMQNNQANKNGTNQVDIWSLWANAARNVPHKIPENYEKSHLFQRYFAQLAERWNSFMARQFAKPEYMRYHPYLQADRHTQTSSKQSPIPENSLRSDPKETNYGDNHNTVNCLSPEAGSVSSPLSDVAISQELLKSSEVLSPKEVNQSTETDKRDEEKCENADLSPLTENGVPIVSKTSNSFSFSNSLSSPNVVAQTDSPRPNEPPTLFLSTSPQGDSHPNLADQINSVVPYHPWQSPNWMGFSATKSDNSPSYRSLPHTPTEKKTSCNQFLLDTKTAQFDPDILRRKSVPAENIKSPAISTSISTPGINSNSPSPVSIPPQRKFSAPVGPMKNSDIFNQRALEDMRRHYSVVHPPFVPQWFGSAFPANQIASPTFAGIHSPLTSNASKPQMFFPSRMPIIPPNGFPLGGALSPQSAQTYSTAQHPYKSDLSSQLQSTSGKLSRRTRTRGPPIDSVHAAIVREAKEQFKGLDPENMYIQCPICQKRIKRLYHFQRHMRIHTGEKTHQCPCCQYKSVRKDNLKSHMKTHEKHTLENSRKGSKANFQQSRKAESLNAGSPNNEVKESSINVPVKPADHLTDVPLVAGELNKTSRSPPGAISNQTSNSARWKEIPDWRFRFNQPFYNPYGIPTFSTNFKTDFTQTTILNGDVGNKLKRGPDAANVTASSPNFPRSQQTSAFDQKAENGGRVTERRTQINASAEDGLATSRRISATSPTILTSIAQTDNKALGNDGNLRDLLSNSNQERAAKRPKIMLNGRSLDTEEPPLTNTNQNNNNNNNRRKSSIFPESAFRPISTFQTEQRDVQPTVYPIPFLPIYSSNQCLPKVDQTDQYKLTEKGAIPSNQSIENRKFESGASATLAGLAAAAAAATMKSQNGSKCPDDTLSSNPSEKNNSCTVAVPFASHHGTEPSALHHPAKALNADVNDTARRSLSSVPSLSRRDLNEIPCQLGSDDDVKSPDDIPKEKISNEYTVNGDCDVAIKAESRPTATNPQLEADKPSPLKNDNETFPSTSDANKQKSQPCKRTENRNENSSVEAKGSSCRLCSFQSTSTIELHSHVAAMHKQDGFYKCDECSYLGKNLSKLVEHIRIHTGERPFKCDQCSYAAKRKDNLAQHKAVRHDKRKTKSNSLYTVLDQITCETATVARKRNSVAGTPHHFPDKKMEASETSLPPPAFERFSLFPNLRYLPSMDVGSDLNFNREFVKEKSPTSTASPTMQFSTFHPVQTFPASVFQYPYYPPHPIIPPMELHPGIGGSAVKAVGDRLANPGTYSAVKVRAALISP